jgi:fructose-bisphosphate aldolase class II
MHGSSGVAIGDIQKAVSAGIRKVNISTELNKQMTEAIRSYLQNNPDVVDPRKYLSAGRTAVEAGVYDYLKALSN